jgi:hypothetical protein
MALLTPLIKRNMMAAAKDIAPVVGMSALGGAVGGMNSPSEEMTPNAIVLGALMGAGAGRVGQRAVGKLIGKPSGLLNGVKRSASSRRYEWRLPEKYIDPDWGDGTGQVYMTRDGMLGNKPEDIGEAMGIARRDGLREGRLALRDLGRDKDTLRDDRRWFGNTPPNIAVSMGHSGNRDLMQEGRAARDLFAKTFAVVEDHMARHNAPMYEFSPASKELERLYTSRMLSMPRHRYVPIRSIGRDLDETYPADLALVHPHIAYKLTSGPDADWALVTKRSKRVPRPKDY